MIVNKYANGNGGGGTGSTITIDAALSSSSTNPVENRVITNALSEYATEAYVDNAITAATEDLASTQYVDDAIAGIVIPEPPEDYATTGDVANAVEGLASETYVDDAISTATEHMVTTDDLQDYATEQYVDDAVNGLAQGIGMLGMVNDVSESNGTVTVMKTTMQEGQLVTGSTSFDIVTSGDIQNFVTSGDVATAITAATENFATEQYVDDAIAAIPTGSTVTVDSALSSSSTNPVQNKVIYDALNGVTSSTQMEVSTASDYSMRVRIYDATGSDGDKYFNSTNISGYYVINLADVATAVTGSNSKIRIYYFTIDNTTYFLDSYYSPTSQDIGEKRYLKPNSGSDMEVESNNLDGTFEYYLILKINQDSKYVYLSQTLPVITEVTDHAANISDIPVAQDNSGFNKFVYYDGEDYNKTIMARIDGSPTQYFGQTKSDTHPAINLSSTFWNAFGSTSKYLKLPYGNEVIGGAKTARDSVIIDKAEQALSGLTETITLTLGSASTDTIQLNWNTVQLFETDNPRYLAVELRPNSYNYVQTLSIGGTVYIITNRNYGTSILFDQRGIYQLVERGSDSFTFAIDCQNFQTQNYIIIDKELLTLEIASGLTITRAKSIPQAISAATQNFVTSGDVTTIVDAAVATAITIDTALSTGSTNPVQNQVITNALANFVQSTSVKTIVSCTQAQYDAMATHDPNTFYIITGVNS